MAYAERNPIWTLFERLTPTAVGAINSSPLPAHDLWLVIMRCTKLEFDVAVRNFYLRLNGDIGNNYNFLRHAGAAVGILLNQPYFQLAVGSQAGVGMYSMMGKLTIEGRRSGFALSRLLATGEIAHDNLGVGVPVSLIHGYYVAAADLNTITLGVDVGTMTGTINIYYMDF